jgi:hypothetical protein
MTISGDGPSPRATLAELSQRLRRTYGDHVRPGEQSLLLAWSTFATTFGATRALTHWIRAGHGPAGGGMSVGGRHFHHYNIGIILLSAIGAVALRGEERHANTP